MILDTENLWWRHLYKHIHTACIPLPFTYAEGGGGLSCRTVVLLSKNGDGVPFWYSIIRSRAVPSFNKATYGPGPGIFMYTCTVAPSWWVRIVLVGKKVCKRGAIYILVDWTFWCKLTLSAFLIYVNRYSSANTTILYMYTYRYKLILVFFQSMPVVFFSLNYPCIYILSLDHIRSRNFFHEGYKS